MIQNIPIIDNNPVNIPITTPIQIVIKDSQGATLEWHGNEGHFVTTSPGTRDKPIFFPTPMSLDMLADRFNCNPRALMEGRMR